MSEEHFLKYEMSIFTFTFYFFPLKGKCLLAFLYNLITTDSVYYEAFEV